jgi:cobalt-zinc-cadmium efflux system membrane fusion protein
MKGNTRLPSRSLLVVCLSVCVMSCRAAEPATQASTGDPAAPAEAVPPGHVRIDPDQLSQIRIETLSTDSAADAINATGAIEFNADAVAKLLPPVSGQLQDLKANVGDSIRRDQVVFALNSREAASAIAEHAASRKDLELAEKTYAMTRDLFEHEAASRIALEQSENELSKAKSKVQQTGEVLQVLGLTPDEAGEPRPRIPVRAPIGGTVVERTAANGQFVGPENGPILTIGDLSSVWVQADVFERDLHLIAIGQPAEVTAAAYPDARFTARVARIAAIVDPQTRTAKVRFLVANPGARLKPGMFATISLQQTSAGSALTVPVNAIFVESGRTFAYLQVGDHEFCRREIEAVPNSRRDRLRVTRGLQAGDRVVSEGVLLIRQLEREPSGQ